LSELLLLPPQAARPMANNATAAIVRRGARLTFIAVPLLRVIPNLAVLRGGLVGGID
jgi:hypothetical protein